VLVFCNRKDEVRKLSETLTRYGINCSELSGDVPQKQRIDRLNQFKAGKIRVLVATDVAGRGIHIEGMDHVVTLTLPHDPEDYVHRIGVPDGREPPALPSALPMKKKAFYLPPIEAFMARKLDCIRPEKTGSFLPKPVTPRKRRRPDAAGRPRHNPAQNLISKDRFRAPQAMKLLSK